MLNRLASSSLKAAVFQAMLLQLCVGVLQLYFLCEDPFFADSVGDAAYYLQSAQRIWEGQWEPSPLFYAPGMTLLRLALLPFGSSPWPYQFLALAAGSGLMGLIVLLSGRAARLCSAPGREEQASLLSARLATLLWLSCPMGLFFQAEPVFPLWAAVGVLGALALLSSSSFLTKTGSTCAGLLIGFAALGQTSLLLLVPLISLWLWFECKELSKSLFFCAGSLALFLPIVTYHLSLDEFVLLRTAGGFNFLVGNECGSAGVFHVPKGMSGAFTQESLPLFVRRFASLPGGPLVSESEADRILYLRGLQEFSECGVRETIGLYFKKLYLLFCSSEIGIHRQQAFADQWVPFRSYLFVSQAVLVAASLPVLYALSRRRMGRLLLLTAVGVTISVLPFFVADRLRFPLLCLCAILAATGLSSLLGKSARYLLIWAALGGLVAYGLHRPPNIPRLYRLEALEWERLGALYANQNRFQASKAALTTCLARAPESENCAWILTRVLLKLNEKKLACSLLQQLLQASPRQAYQLLDQRSCQP